MSTDKTSGFDWEKKDDLLVVDVGGGIGVTSELLLRSFPKLKIILQDQELVIKNAEKVRSRSSVFHISFISI